MKKKYEWEDPKVIIDLRDPQFTGKNTEAIERLTDNLLNYLNNPNIEPDKKAIYSAIYNALSYYKIISYYPSADYSTDSFLTYTIQELNDEYNYLKKYNQMYPNNNPVIRLEARIKSPISFINKTLEKIDEYRRDKCDFTHLNDSIRDLMAAKIIVTPPKEIKAKGKQAEADFLYSVYLDWLNFHGVNEPSFSPSEHKYQFIPVNTAHDPQKLEKLKKRPSIKGFAKGVLEKIYIPKHRHPALEGEIDSFTKDYVMYPKETGYQALHTCIVPSFSKYVDRPEIATCVTPPAYYDYCIEYQFLTEEQYHNSTHGFCSHDDYKESDRDYSRYAIPLYIAVDDITIMDAEELSFHKTRDVLRPRPIAECIRKFYGEGMLKRFGILPLSVLNRDFPQHLDAVLERREISIYDSKAKKYCFVDAYKQPIVGTREELKELSEEISEHPEDARQKVKEKYGLDSSTPEAEVYVLVPSEEREAKARTGNDSTTQSTSLEDVPDNDGPDIV